MLRSLLRSCAAVASLALVFTACGSGDVALGSNTDAQTHTGDGSTGTTSACQAAGGTCLATGGDFCASRAPDSAQDCTPDLLPSGTFCCLDANESDAGSQLAACTMSPTVQALDSGASTTECTAARTLLICTTRDMGTSNAGEVCLSNDPSGCPSSAGALTDAGTVCDDECAANEYAVACGFGPGDAPSPPAGCRIYGSAPSGTVYSCCPCGG